MAVFNDTASGDALYSFTASAGRLAFQNKFTTKLAYVRQADGSYVRRHIGRFISDEWYETAQGPLEYAESVLSPED